MPSTNNRALLLQLEAFMADNNIRRGLFTVVANAQATDSNVIEQTFAIEPNTSRAFVCLPTNTATVIRASKTVKIKMKINQVDVEGDINSLFVYTGPLEEIELSVNLGQPTSQIRILQV